MWRSSRVEITVRALALPARARNLRDYSCTLRNSSCRTACYNMFCFSCVNIWYLRKNFYLILFNFPSLFFSFFFFKCRSFENWRRMIRWREFPFLFLFFSSFFISSRVELSPRLRGTMYNYCTRLYMVDWRAYGNANSTAVPCSGNFEGSAGMWFLATRVNRPLQLCVACAWRLNPPILCGFFSFFFFLLPLIETLPPSSPFPRNYSLWKIANNRNNSLPPSKKNIYRTIILRYRDKSRYEIDRFSFRENNS